MTGQMPFLNRYCFHWPVVKFQNVVKIHSTISAMAANVWTVTAVRKSSRPCVPCRPSPEKNSVKIKRACDQCQNLS